MSHTGTSVGYARMAESGADYWHSVLSMVREMRGCQVCLVEWSKYGYTRLSIIVETAYHMALRIEQRQDDQGINVELSNACLGVADRAQESCFRRRPCRPCVGRWTISRLARYRFQPLGDLLDHTSRASLV